MLSVCQRCAATVLSQAWTRAAAPAAVPAAVPFGWTQRPPTTSEPIVASSTVPFLSVSAAWTRKFCAFAYSINSTSYAGYVCANGKQGTTGGATSSCKSATVTGVQPPSAGPNTLYVKEYDSAGNASPNPRKYSRAEPPPSAPRRPCGPPATPRRNNWADPAGYQFHKGDTSYRECHLFVELVPRRPGRFWVAQAPPQPVDSSSGSSVS
ncbi:hypothetical protein OG352_24655 [Streptomyces sp. NBC_01485]|uniref:hypothetical protein n=1 Tax=Streptomyces sp. NBC_01485 TaxID=2903884 RepID=UPI002E2F6D7A|nr:hypothetical protein [Streptomyces sp. NBC_01485]